jgi:AcrR family transcriptional regulator
MDKRTEILPENMSRHQRNRLRTRHLLEQAVFDLLQEKGYEAITIQDIVDTADLGRGTFYLHFKDKEEAVWSLIEHGLQQTDFMAHQMFEQDPASVTFEIALQNMFRHVEANQSLFKIMLGSRGNAVVTLKVQDWLAKDMEREARSLQMLNLIQDVPLPIAAQLVTGAITRLAIWWLETPNEYSADEMAAFAYQGLRKGIAWV